MSILFYFNYNTPKLIIDIFNINPKLRKILLYNIIDKKYFFKYLDDSLIFDKTKYTLKNVGCYNLCINSNNIILITDYNYKIDFISQFVKDFLEDKISFDLFSSSKLNVSPKNLNIYLNSEKKTYFMNLKNNSDFIETSIIDSDSIILETPYTDIEIKTNCKCSIL